MNNVSSLNLDATDYRHGNSPIFYPIKIPGIKRVPDTDAVGGITNAYLTTLQSALDKLTI